MQVDHSNYEKEKYYALSHLLFIGLLTLLSFFLIRMTGQNLNPDFFILKVLLIGLSFYSLLYYAFVIKFPSFLVQLRQFTLILVDLIVLTLSIIFMGPVGLFFLPLYILIVMESGINFGFVHFFFSIVLSALSWFLLVYYSTYWLEHSDTVAIFAITTILIPLFYLKKMVNMHQKHEQLHETLVSSNHEANFDTLTGLPNRKQYDTYMKNLLEEEAFFALLFIDLNKFKVINDTYGHDLGDEVLIEVAKRLSQSIDEEDILARLGGDEFVIITKRKKVFLDKFLEKLEQNTIKNHTVGDVTVLIELSIGISLFPDDSKSETFLRKYADEAMYVAKKTRGRHHIFYDEIKSKN